MLCLPRLQLLSPPIERGQRVKPRVSRSHSQRFGGQEARPPPPPEKGQMFPWPVRQCVRNHIPVLGGAGAVISARTRVVRSTRGGAASPVAPAALAGASSATAVSATFSTSSVAAVVAVITAAASAQVTNPARAPEGASVAMTAAATPPLPPPPSRRSPPPPPLSSRIPWWVSPPPASARRSWSPWSFPGWVR